MKVVVPVKQVAKLDEDFELRGGDVDPAGLEWELNEWDTFSLEAALQLRDAAGGGEVVAVSVGDEEAEAGLLRCLAMGADRGIRIWHDGLEGADALAIARVVAAAVERESPDLVLCGVQSSDAVNSATGIAIAGHLGLAHVAVVKRIELTGSTATCERELEGGLVEVLRIELPALLTIQTGINEPRYATLRAIKQAREKPLDVVAPAAIGIEPAQIDAASGGRRRALEPPQVWRGAEMLDGTTAEVAERIAAIVRERAA
ncbi:MAG: electron transfer flavoprotein subunit beta/FixA family protein [Solirubrobacteraceae bacterium]